MTSLRPLLERLEDLLRGQGAPVVDLLADGLPEHVVREDLETYVGHAPQEVVDWFSWHDGLRQDQLGPGVPPQHAMLLGGFQPIRLDAAEAEEWFAKPIHGWQRGWLRFLVCDPVNVVLDCSEPGDSTRVLVHEVRRYERPSRLVTDSLTDFVSAWLEAFDLGVRWDRALGAWQLPDRPIPADLQTRTGGYWPGRRQG